MTIEQIRAALQGIEVRHSSNGGWCWATMRIDIRGERRTRSVRLPLEPSDADISGVRKTLEDWRSEELNS